jgi:hypothetical protein
MEYAIKRWHAVIGASMSVLLGYAQGVAAIMFLVVENHSLAAGLQGLGFRLWIGKGNWELER